MKYSEFINIYALNAYFSYCSAHNLEPNIDIKQPTEKKVCALLKPKLENETTTAQTRTITESTNG